MYFRGLIPVDLYVAFRSFHLGFIPVISSLVGVSVDTNLVRNSFNMVFAPFTISGDGFRPSPVPDL